MRKFKGREVGGGVQWSAKNFRGTKAFVVFNNKKKGTTFIFRTIK